MKMNKKTQLFIGVGLVAVAGYLLYRNSQSSKASFANQTGGKRRGTSKLAPLGLGAPDCNQNLDANDPSQPTGCKCPCNNVLATGGDGTTFCQNGHSCCMKQGNANYGKPTACAGRA